jgi:hypothetical protein
MSQALYRIAVEETDDGRYKATEPWGDRQLWGRGKTPHEAIRNYCELTSLAGPRR